MVAIDVMETPGVSRERTIQPGPKTRGAKDAVAASRRGVGTSVGWGGGGVAQARLGEARGFQLCSQVSVGVIHKGRKEGSVGRQMGESGAKVVTEEVISV